MEYFDTDPSLPTSPRRFNGILKKTENEKIKKEAEEYNQVKLENKKEKLKKRMSIQRKQFSSFNRRLNTKSQAIFNHYSSEYSQLQTNQKKLAVTVILTVGFTTTLDFLSCDIKDMKAAFIVANYLRITIEFIILFGMKYLYQSFKNQANINRIKFLVPRSKSPYNLYEAGNSILYFFILLIHIPPFIEGFDYINICQKYDELKT